ncbi:hypothetical protein COOONC_20427 [Cooperia oncophora]
MPTHSNARNYMVETLVKYASLLEVQGDLENAKSKFEKVLRIKEDRRARAALAKMDRKKRSPSVEILEDDSDKPKSKNPKRSDIEEEKRKRRRTQEAERERKRERHDNREKMSCANHHMHTGRCLCIHSSLQFLDLAMQSLLLNHGLIPCPLSLVPESPPPEMPVSICDAEDSHDENCGASCSALSDVEKRRINRQLFLAFPPEGARHSGQRMFFFIRGFDELVREDIEESDVFFHDDKCSIVVFDHEGCSTQLSETAEALYRWMRVGPVHCAWKSMS